VPTCYATNLTVCMHARSTQPHGRGCDATFGNEPNLHPTTLSCTPTAPRAPQLPARGSTCTAPDPASVYKRDGV
jgi:hypothetical protein